MDVSYMLNCLKQESALLYKIEFEYSFLQGFGIILI